VARESRPASGCTRTDSSGSRALLFCFASSVPTVPITHTWPLFRRRTPGTTFTWHSAVHLTRCGPRFDKPWVIDTCSKMHWVLDGIYCHLFDGIAFCSLGPLEQCSFLGRNFAKFRPKKYDLDLDKGFFIEKMTPNHHILIISFSRYPRI
jgi:hypothetical protein